jgi:hypothetical protein
MTSFFNRKKLTRFFNWFFGGIGVFYVFTFVNFICFYFYASPLLLSGAGLDLVPDDLFFREYGSFYDHVPFAYTWIDFNRIVFDIAFKSLPILFLYFLVIYKNMRLHKNISRIFVFGSLTIWFWIFLFIHHWLF